MFSLHQTLTLLLPVYTIIMLYIGCVLDINSRWILEFMVVCCVDVCGVFVSWLENRFRESIRLFRRPQASQTSFYIILG